MWKNYQDALEQQVVNFQNLYWVSPLWFWTLQIIIMVTTMLELMLV